MSDAPTASMSGDSGGPERRGDSAFERAGDEIGPYKLISPIGEGGFGTVWIAERRQPFTQRVALKLIKAGMDSRAVIARFEQERQALAVMDHPNIARVLDGGITPQGRPYFAMELVKGDPITAFCDRNRLTIAQRLALFTTVCEAVQHAHLKGIIHRDIKPSNVLVAAGEAGPVVKVIDFGVAKAVSSTMTEKTIFTERGQIIGTPEYMSPEQAEMGATDVDTRTDVYSLGVVLYELVSGTLPFDPKSLRARGYAEIQRIIREVDPPKPSTRLSTIDNDAATAIAHARQDERARIASLLRRELDWIPLKALRKDRSERYTTPHDLAEDVRRYLRGDALVAGPESAAYRLRKTVRRNRGAFAAVAAVIVALALGLAGTLWKAAEAEAARDESEAARRRADSVNEFIAKALRSTDPLQGGTQDATIAEAMRNAIRELDGGVFADDPRTETVLRGTIGTIMQNNGRLQEAEALAARALELQRAAVSGDTMDLASAINNLALAREALGQLESAQSLCSEALAMYGRLCEGDHFAKARCMGNLARVQQALGQRDEALQVYAEVVAMMRRLHAGDDEDLALAINNHASALGRLGRHQESQGLYRQVLEMQRRLFAGKNNGDHPNIALTLNNLALAEQSLGRNAEAEPLITESIAMFERIYRGDHPTLVPYLNNLGFIRTKLGRLDEAQAALEKALAVGRRVHAGDQKDVAFSLNNLATVLEMKGDVAAAEPLYADALAMRQRLYADVSGGDHPDVAWSAFKLARARLALGQRDAARALAEQALAMATRVLPANDATLARYRDLAAQCAAPAAP